MSQRDIAAPSVPRLMLVTNRKQSRWPLPDLAARAVAGGFDWIQIREKDLAVEELRETTAEVKNAVGSWAAILVNNQIDVAAELGTGLHLPESAGFDLRDIRSRLAPGALAGRSVHCPEQAKRSDGFDYLIAGPFAATASKPGSTPIGIDRLSKIVDSSACPVIAIGGINEGQVAHVLDAGAHGVAVMSLVGRSSDPQQTAAKLRKALERARMNKELNRSSSISIQVNGKPATIASGWSIGDFLASKDLHERLVVVEHNGTILRHPDFGGVELEEGDILEIVHFVGGGSQS